MSNAVAADRSYETCSHIMLNPAASQNKGEIYDLKFTAKGKHFWNGREGVSENLLLHKDNKEHSKNLKKCFLKFRSYSKACENQTSIFV